ncbi:hypothetical protein ASE08_09135 [Rhizobacter sp. Root16D2]|nr:hypothetical protein ASC88_14365 [Rhizobacter sp. Root29]KQW04286.1 hypothetical protein ASC98_04055 [Rhizobacter sp. Root1238]KRB14592.1 hypothetical protein ASE08_09135 [Rhizobacter sp. Root16D2]
MRLPAPCRSSLLVRRGQCLIFQTLVLIEQYLDPLGLVNMHALKFLHHALQSPVLRLQAINFQFWKFDRQFRQRLGMGSDLPIETIEELEVVHLRRPRRRRLG